MHCQRSVENPKGVWGTPDSIGYTAVSPDPEKGCNVRHFTRAAKHDEAFLH